MKNKLTINQQTVIKDTLSFFNVFKESGDFTNQELIAKTYSTLIRICKIYRIRKESSQERLWDVCLKQIRLIIPMIKGDPCWKCGAVKTGRNPYNKKWECFDCYFNIKTDKNGKDYMDLKIVGEVKINENDDKTERFLN